MEDLDLRFGRLVRPTEKKRFFLAMVLFFQLVFKFSKGLTLGVHRGRDVRLLTPKDGKASVVLSPGGVVSSRFTEAFWG